MSYKVTLKVLPTIKINSKAHNILRFGSWSYGKKDISIVHELPLEGTPTEGQVSRRFIEFESDKGYDL